MATIGFIGLGIMGAPMARNLLGGGHALRVYDIDQTALQKLTDAGATAAASAAAAADGAEFVITMLPTGSHVNAALFDAGGAAATLADDALFIDMSTIMPLETDAIAEQLSGRGKAMIDAPVGRTSQHAIDGKLLIMVGGADADVSRARPVLELMGDTLVHCGRVGTGSRMKIVNNYLSIASNVLIAEALTLAESAGLDVAQTVDVLRGTTAGIGHLNTTYPAQVLAGNVDPGFMIKLADKDMGLALELAGKLNAPTAMGAVARQTMSIAKVRGRGDQDWTAVYQVVRELAGLEKN